MANDNLEKIIKVLGSPTMNSYDGNSNLTGVMHNVIIEYDNQTQKYSSINFKIESKYPKLIKSMISACTLNKEIEAYGLYKSNTVNIDKIKINY